MFELVQQREWTGFQEGYVKVDFGDGVIFDVKKGDRYGFSWLNFGVIAWDVAGEKNFCEANELFNQGDIATLKDEYGDRIYSIKMNLTPCQPTTEPPPQPQCQECYCVDPETGAEEDGTRTDGDLECE